LHPKTLAFVFALIVVLAIFQLYPLAGDSTGDNHTGLLTMVFGFPVICVRIGVDSTDFVLDAFLVDVFVVGMVILAFTFWMDLWLKRLEAMRSWYKLHFPTWILLAILALVGVIVERIPIVLDPPYTDYMDEIRGVPFAYHRVRLIMDNAPRITFDSIMLAFDILLIGAGIAELTYWFERWQRNRILPIEEG